MNFKNWTDAKNRAEELDLYTKAYLKEKYNRKPITDAKGEWHRVYTDGRWKDFYFYNMKDTVEIKKRTKREVVKLEISEENICKALYIINKSAKKSRDTKVNAYNNREFGVVSSAKSRQNKLYTKKDMAIRKAIERKYIILEGYHTQTSTKIAKLLMYRSLNTGLMFHIPIEEVPTGIKYLGNIEGKISAEATLKTNITYTQAVELIDRFLSI